MPQLRDAAARLAALDCCRLTPGLTSVEFARVEARYGFTFADDHRAFLATALPVDDDHDHDRHHGWPDWRDGDPAVLRDMLDWPVEGVLFDVEHNAMWDPAWGPRPHTVPERLAVARRHLASVPQLVPIYAHRYLPAGISEHPVLSVYQTDIIYYGVDLSDYIHQEFGGPGMSRADPAWQPVATVPFWRDFL